MGLWNTDNRSKNRFVENDKGIMGMDSNNIIKQSPSFEDIEGKVKSCFIFLEEEYNFKYDGPDKFNRRFEYSSSKVRLSIQLGRNSLYVFIYKIGEPEFTRLIVDRIIQYHKLDIQDMYYPFHTIEENISHIATLIENNAHKTVCNVEDWWIPIQLFQYKLLEAVYTENDQYDDFVISYKKDFNYLKSKGAFV